MYGCASQAKSIREIIFFHFSSRGKMDSMRYPIESPSTRVETEADEMK